MTLRRYKLLRSLLLCASPIALAQQPGPLDTAPAQSARFPASWYPAGDAYSTTFAPQRGHPYLATAVVDAWYFNPKTDETTSHVLRTLQARDSLGRKREEMEQPRPGLDGRPVNVRQVSVTDPVSHCQFGWSEPWIPGPGGPEKPFATVTCRPRVALLQDYNVFAEIITAPEGETRSYNTVSRVERLRPTTMEGVRVVGTRNTKTLTKPDGTPDWLVMEWWYSPELEELVSMRPVMPSGVTAQRSGVPNLMLTDIRQIEPDPKLFYPPAGYEIRSELSHSPGTPRR